MTIDTPGLLLTGAVRGRFARCVASTAAALVAGCANAPVARFHSLLEAPSARELPVAPALAASVAWSIAGVTVPPAVERPQWVVRASDGTLAVLENERWIAPPADELRAAVAARLARAVGVEGLVPAPGRIGWRIAVAVQRFDMQPARAASLEAVWSIGSADTAAAARLVCAARFETGVEPGYPALAAGHRQAVGRLADAVAAALAALDRGELAACP